MVKIYVGAEKVCWVIHEDLICNKSSYFRGAFRGGFIESANKSIHLEDEDPSIFKIVVEWLYNGSIQCKDWHKFGEELYLLRWYKLIAVADKFGLNGLDAAAEWGHYDCEERSDHAGACRPLVEEIKFVYEKCSAASFARIAVKDRASTVYFSKSFKDFMYWGEITACNAEFAGDMGRAIKVHTESDECHMWDCSAHSE